MNGIGADDLLKVMHYYGLLQNNTYDAFKIICPFHEDLKPSMMVDLTKGTFYCYGCDAKGDAAKFVQLIEKVDELHAYIMLAKIRKSTKQVNLNIRKIVRLEPSEYLKEAKEYFYSLNKVDWHDIKSNYMFGRGFKPNALNDADVRINQDSTYGIIAPLLDMGRFRGWVKRATVEEDNGRKYLYNTGFSRRNTLIGYYDRPWPIVTEGYMDVLRAHQFGARNTCGLLGWKATQEQIEKLRKCTDCVISGLDNTKSGRDGTAFLRQYFEVVRFRFPATVKDLGEIDKYDFNKAMADTIQVINKRYGEHHTKADWR